MFIRLHLFTPKTFSRAGAAVVLFLSVAPANRSSVVKPEDDAGLLHQQALSPILVFQRLPWSKTGSCLKCALTTVLEATRSERGSVHIGGESIGDPAFEGRKFLRDHLLPYFLSNLTPKDSNALTPSHLEIIEAARTLTTEGLDDLSHKKRMEALDFLKRHFSFPTNVAFYLPKAERKIALEHWLSTFHRRVTEARRDDIQGMHRSIEEVLHAGVALLDRLAEGQIQFLELAAFHSSKGLSALFGTNRMSIYGRSHAVSKRIHDIYVRLSPSLTTPPPFSFGRSS